MPFSAILDWRLPEENELLWRVAECRGFEAYLQESHGFDEPRMMDAAGRGAASWLAAQPEFATVTPGAPLLVLAGPGNNGGDALVAAVELWRRGHRALELWAPLGLPPAASSAAGQARLTATRLGVPRAAESATGLPGTTPGAILDGLFGIGLARPLRGRASACLTWCDAQPAPRFALDLPSGLDGDSGEVLGVSLPATATLTFIGPKAGCYAGQGPAYCGRLAVGGIGAPHELARAWLAERRRRDR